MSFSFLLADKERIVRIVDLLNVVRGNYHLNFLFNEGIGNLEQAVESSAIAFPVHFRTLIEVLMSPA